MEYALCHLFSSSFFFFLSKIREWNFYYRDIYDHRTVCARLLCIDELCIILKKRFSKLVEG